MILKTVNEYSYFGSFQTRGMKIKDFDEFIGKIKEDNGLESHDITILIGPYYQTDAVLGAQVLRDKHFSNKYYIVCDIDFYFLLNEDERKAIIAHEMGHIVLNNANAQSGSNKARYYMDDVINQQILADNFALRYVEVVVFMNTLKKVYTYNPEYTRRIYNLIIIQQKQGR